MIGIDRRIIAHFDLPLFLVTIFIPLCGLVVLYSAGFDPDSEGLKVFFLDKSFKSPAFVKQAAYLAGGILLVGITFTIHTLTYKRMAYILYGLCILLLIATPFFGVLINGSRRWIPLGFMNIQPSELAKLGVVLVMARFLSKRGAVSGGYSIGQLIIPSLFFIVPAALIMQQPDLGTAISIVAVGFCMILFMGIKPRALGQLSLIGVVSMVPAWFIMLKPYQRRRISTVLNPDQDPMGSGYHVIQSKIAVGSGQLFGKGFLQGTQTQLEFLPEHTTDFVFSVLAEEWGFAGSLFVLSLYFVLLLLLLRVASRARDTFSALVCFGVATLIFFHLAVNIGMVLGLLPVVGLTLPLFSYGGSSMLTFLTGIGIVLGISMRRFELNNNIN